ncbi:hypothetical protein BH18ACT8_BH18ACT8_04350 [soil metagenome]
MSGPRRIEVTGVVGLPEIRSGDDLGPLIVGHSDPPLRDGDVVVVTSKVISKAGGLVRSTARAGLVAAHTARVVARHGSTNIVRTRRGLTLAAAGLDTSNTAAGTVLMLPDDPDAEAVALRRSLRTLTGTNVAVVVTDTAGRPWRQGQTDMAIGVAGMLPIHDLTGVADGYGNILAVTAPAVADAVAAAADLVQGKLERIPVAVVTGLAAWVLPVEVDGPGAAALVRPAEADLFGWGAGDAVRVAVRRDDPDQEAGFALPTVSTGQLIDDAMAAADRTTVTARPAEEGWDIEAVDGGSGARAVWEAAAFVERLRVLAVSARRELELTVDVFADDASPRLARVRFAELPSSDAATT